MNSYCVYILTFRECLGEAHEPCDCQTWKDWLQKISEMKPEERKSCLFYSYYFVVFFYF